MRVPKKITKTSKSMLVTGFVLAGFAAGYFARIASAGGIPTTAPMTYSGVLEDANGIPLKGNHAVDFRLWDADKEGKEKCVVLNPKDGYDLGATGRFSIELVKDCTDAVKTIQDLWVEIRVEGSPLPRTKLGAVPYAVEAAHAASADSAMNATNAAIATGALAQQVVPSGAIMFFNLAACPAGWSDAVAAQGRYLVGMSSGGTLGGAVGTALNSGENRSVGQHTHGVSDPSHAHGVSDPGHAHGVGAGSVFLYWNGQTCVGSVGQFGSSGGNCLNSGVSTGSGVTAVSIKSTTTGVSVTNAGSVAGTNAPYIQFRVCQKI